MLEANWLTTSPDETAAIETINGIYRYVRAQRVKVPKFPKVLPLIQDFESWYQGLETSTKTGIIVHTVGAADVDIAKIKREAVNQALGEHLPDDVTPADSPQTPPPMPDSGGGFGAVTWLLLAIGAGALYKLLH